MTKVRLNFSKSYIFLKKKRKFGQLEIRKKLLIQLELLLAFNSFCSLRDILEGLKKDYVLNTYVKVKTNFFAGIRHPLFVLTGSLFNQVLWFCFINQSIQLKSEPVSTKRGWRIPAKKIFFTFTV